MITKPVKNTRTNMDTQSANALHDYQTGEYIREATPEESASSNAAARHDGGAGVIIVDGRSCYVSP